MGGAAQAGEYGLGARKVLGAAPGHDGQAVAHLTEVGMIFVRCAGGISHNPAEHATVADMGLAIEALIRVIEKLGDEERNRS